MAGEYTLTGSITNSSTTLILNSVTGLPSVPFKIVLEPGLAGEEIVKVTGVAGTALTVVRGWDSSAAVSHDALVKVRHMMTAEDLRLSRAHEDATSGAHGVTGTFVGTSDTQTLTNKNLTSGTNTFPTNLLTDSSTNTVTNKNLTSGSNTFPTSLATLTGAQTLTNKDLTSGTNTFPTSLVTLTGTQTLTNKTLGATTVTVAAATAPMTWNNNLGLVARLSANALEVNGGAFKAYYPVDAALIKQQVNITAPAADVRPLVLKGAASQTANLQEWRNSVDTVLASVAADGTLTAPDAALAAATINGQAVPKMAYGVTTGTTDVNGNLTISHPLGVTPTVVQAQLQGATDRFSKPHGTRNTTTFAVHCRSVGGGALASTSVTIEWVVYAP